MTAERGPRPFVKYVGGKTRLVPHILKRMPAAIGTYVEPFVGGGAVFFALAAERPRRFERAVLNDANRDLITCYLAVRDDVEGLIEELHEYRYSRRAFYAARGANTAMMTVTERAARSIYLNKTCFNGLWRVNAAGNFNVPFGRFKNPTICDEDGLRAASEALQCADIHCKDFRRLFNVIDPPRGSFVYFDPPYVPVSKSADFTAYTRTGFGPDDQRDLAALARRLTRKGGRVLLSNADVAAVRALYDSERFIRSRVMAPRSINCKATKRGAVRELLISPR